MLRVIMLIVARSGLCLAVPVVVLGGLMACSQASKRPAYLPDFSPDGSADAYVPPPPVPDASAPDAASVCAVSDLACNQLLNCGGKVFIRDVATDALTASGGTLVDGTYAMTDFVIFTGPGGVTATTDSWFVENIQLASGTFNVVSDTNMTTTGSETFSGTYMVQPTTTLNFTYACQSPQAMTPNMRVYSYTAQPGQLLLDIAAAAGGYPARASYTQM